MTARAEMDTAPEAMSDRATVSGATAPLRSTHVLASVADPSAGPSQSVTELCRALASLGVEVGIETVAGWRERNDAPAADSLPAGVPVRRHPRSTAGLPVLRSLCASAALRAALAAIPPGRAVFHTHGLWLMPNVYPATVGARCGIPVVHSIRGMLGPEALAFSRQKKRLFDVLFQRRALRAASCLHATSLSEYEEIRAYGLGNPVTIIPNGISIPADAATTRIASAHRVALSLGRVHPKKGLDNLVRAWGQVEAAHPDWRLRIVGPAELRHDEVLRALAESLGLRRVSIEPALYGADKLAAYRAADLFVLPTRNENFAMTVAEALAAGTPVISTKGAPWAGLERERCGWWIDHGPEPLAATLGQAMAMPQPELRAMGARGRAWMARDFSWRRIAGDMRDLYIWLLDSGAQPATVRQD